VVTPEAHAIVGQAARLLADAQLARVLDDDHAPVGGLEPAERLHHRRPARSRRAVFPDKTDKHFQHEPHLLPVEYRIPP
jgi:hypothetical protein